MSPVTTKTVVAFDPVTEERSLLERCERLVASAVRAGADEAEAYGSRSESIAVRFEKGDLKLAQVDDGTSAGVRVFRERRLGFASTNQADARSLESTARDAVALAAFAPPHEANVLPAPRPIPARPTLVHPAWTVLEVDAIVDTGLDLLRRAQAVDRRISIDNASCELVRVSHAIHTGGGLRASESDALLTLGIFGMAVDGEDVGGFHYGGDALRDPRGVEAALATLVDDFTSVALGNLGAGKAESYRGPVLFAPDALLDLFVEPVVSAASAIAVQRGRSALARKLGQAIGIDALDIVDDPTDRALAGAGAFDREGIPIGRFPIVERGVLKTWLYNGYAAAVEGRASTGHASGGARGVPGLGPHAIVVGGGEGGSRADMLRSLGRGLFVQRFSGTVDPASGDFSGVAKSARWVEGGDCVRSVRETLLSGNAFELLKRIVRLSTTVDRVSGSARAPFAIVDGVSVTAG